VTDGFTPIFSPAGTGHRAGAVPDPGATTPANYVLRADATWGAAEANAAHEQVQLVALTIATGNASATGAAVFNPVFGGVPYVLVSGDNPAIIASASGATAGGCVVEAMADVPTIASMTENVTVLALYF
jgi:hypothetical protein